MIIDSSALVAILRDEPETRTFAQAISEADAVSISAVTLVEVSIVMMRRPGRAGLEGLDALMDRSGIKIVPFDAAQAALAREAYLRFGKGFNPAALNFGDCCAYALASARGEPLLYKGTDFGRTDVVAAV